MNAPGSRAPLLGIAGLGAAVAGAFIGALFMWLWTQNELNRVRRGWQLAPVVVVAQDVAAGTVLDLDLVQQQPIPVQFLTDSSVSPRQLNDAVGLRLRSDMRRGDPLRWQDLEPAVRADAGDGDD